MMANRTSGSQTIGLPTPDLNGFVWVYFVFVFLACSAAAQIAQAWILMTVVIASGLFLAPVFGPVATIQNRLVVAALSFGVIVTALYPPILGVFMSLEGRASPFFVKVMLGLRSSLYAIWLAIAVSVIAVRDRSVLGKLQLILIVGVLSGGVLRGAGGLEPRITYLLNSFMPLFLTIAVVPNLIEEGGTLVRDGVRIRRAAVFGAVASFFYFPILMLNLDVFRPDLALQHQMVEGRGLGGALPPQWHSYVGGEFIPRFVGTFPNPILFGYFCAILTYVLWCNRFWKSGAAVFLLTLASLSKGAVLLLFVALFLKFCLKRDRRLFWAALLLVTASELLLAYLLDGSNRVHLRGLIGGMKSALSDGYVAALFGHGLGSGGNLARAELVDGPVSAAWLASGSESGIGVLVYQLGFCGLALFLLLLYRIVHALRSLQDRLLSAGAGVVALCAAWASNMLLQEDLVNVSVCSLMLMGIVILCAGSAEKEKEATARHPVTHRP